MVQEKTLGVFGFPAGHILSPVLHNTAAEALGVPFHYMAFEVRPEALEDAIRGAKAMAFRGLTITIPHKVAVTKLVDEMSEDARLMGAVNTVVFEEGGRLVGHNTDGVGWLRSLEEETGETPEGKRCLVLGAGGAARAIAVKIAQCGAAHIEIRNRTAGRAVELARFVEENIPGARASGGGLEGLAGAAADRELIVNTTSVGMRGDPERVAATPIPEEAIPPGCICTDAVYNPPDTAFLQAAKRRGARAVRGTGWLVYQGAAAWEMWTGTEMPTDLVMGRLLEALAAQ